MKMSQGKSPDAMRGPATSYLMDEGEKMAQDRMLYGGTGGDGDNGNAGEMDKSCCNPSNPSTTGNGSGHWSHK